MTSGRGPRLVSDRCPQATVLYIKYRHWLYTDGTIITTIPFAALTVPVSMSVAVGQWQPCWVFYSSCATWMWSSAVWRYTRTYAKISRSGKKNTNYNVALVTEGTSRLIHSLYTRLCFTTRLRSYSLHFVKSTDLNVKLNVFKQVHYCFVRSESMPNKCHG